MHNISIQFLGQCGFLVSAKTCCGKEIRIAIDTMLVDLLDENGNSARHYPPVCTVAEMNADYIFCTHDHIDHLSMETLVDAAAFKPETKFVVPAGCIDEMVKNGLKKENITGIQSGETVTVADGMVEVKGIQTAHPVHQVDENGLDHNLAFAIKVNGMQIVHLGDTYGTEKLEKNLASLGTIDVLIPPINGRDEERESRGIVGNLNSEQAAALAVKLGAGFTIPAHFDMFIGNTEDPRNFVNAMAALDPDAKFAVPVLLGTMEF